MRQRLWTPAGCAALLAAVALVGPAGARASEWDFKTPGDAAYCRFEFSRNVSAFRCMTPDDGFWLRFTRLGSKTSVRVSKGRSSRFVGYRDAGVRTLGFGKVFFSSDAAVITCWSRRTGLTCKHYDGLSFWLGRSRGYRIYYDAPGFRPHVRPLLRTPEGVWCGINLDTLVPEIPNLLCWRPADGLGLSVGYDGRAADSDRREKARDYRPKGFPLLADGRTLAWRCRRIDPGSAEACSTRAGTPVFTCRNAASRLTCRNRRGHGFRVSRLSFSTF